MTMLFFSVFPQFSNASVRKRLSLQLKKYHTLWMTLLSIITGLSFSVRVMDALESWGTVTHLERAQMLLSNLKVFNPCFFKNVSSTLSINVASQI
jgi:hypothetical protein